MISTDQKKELIRAIESRFGNILNESLKRADKNLAGKIYIEPREEYLASEEIYEPRLFMRNGIIPIVTGKPYISEVYSDIGEYIITISVNNFEVASRGLTEYVENIIYYIIDKCKVYLEIDLIGLFKYIENELLVKECIEELLKRDFTKYIEFCLDKDSGLDYNEEINKKHIDLFNSLISGGKRNYNIIQHLNIISATAYESSTCKGKLAIFKDYESLRTYIDNNKKHTIEFVDEVAIKDYKSARKTMEMSGDEWVIISDCNSIYGISKINCNLKKYTSIVEFIDYYEYSITARCIDMLESNCETDRIIYLKNGNPVVNELEVDTNEDQNIMSIVRSEFNSLENYDENYIENIIEMVKKQEKGTMLVISNQAELEAERLQYQSTLIKPTILTEELINKVSCIDGSILVDEKGRCHAIGVILDGPACKSGSKGRGARYNSAVKYICDRISNEEREYRCLAIVRSEDGMIDIVNRSMFETANTIEEKEENQSKELKLNNIKKDNQKSFSDTFYKYKANKLYSKHINPDKITEFDRIYKDLDFYNKATNYYTDAINKDKDNPAGLYLSRAYSYYSLACREFKNKDTTKYDEFISKCKADLEESLKINKADKRFGNDKKHEELIAAISDNIEVLEKEKKVHESDAGSRFSEILLSISQLDKNISEDIDNPDLYYKRAIKCWALVQFDEELSREDLELNIIINDLKKSLELNPKNENIYLLIKEIYIKCYYDIAPKWMFGIPTKMDEEKKEKCTKLMLELLQYLDNGIKELKSPRMYFLRLDVFGILSELSNPNDKKKYLYNALKDGNKSLELAKNKETEDIIKKIYEALIRICDNLIRLETKKKKVDDLVRRKNTYNKEIKMK